MKSAIVLASLSACGRVPTFRDQKRSNQLKKRLNIRLIENTWIPLPDGRRLAARIWLPTSAESSPVPAILEYLPYRKRDLDRNKSQPAHVYAASCGYAGVRVDIQGTGESNGIIRDEYEKQEQLDGLEILKWLASRCNC